MKTKKSLSHSNIPATVGLVQEVRNELKAEIRAVSSKLSSQDKKIDSVDKKIDSVDKRIDSLECKMDSKFAEMMVVAHRTQVIVEEQRSENRIVLDGLKTMIDRQDRVESDIEMLKSRSF